MQTKRLGELLVEKGLLSPVQVEEALLLQRSSGELLGAILLRKAWISEEQLLSTLSEQFGIPRVRLESEQVDWAVAGQFSLSLFGKQTCFPLRQEEKSVIVAISDPLDAWTVSALEKEARGRRVDLVLASSNEIAAAIQQFRQRTVGKKGGSV